MGVFVAKGAQSRPLQTIYQTVSPGRSVNKGKERKGRCPDGGSRPGQLAVWLAYEVMS